MPPLLVALRRRPSFHVPLRALVVIALLAAAAFFAPRTADAQERFQERQTQERQSFRAFVNALWPEAQRAGVSARTFEAAFNGLTPDPAILSKTQRQAEFVKPIWDYLGSAVSPKRIATGRTKTAEFGQTLTRISKSYGVDPYIVLAVWGMESNFGAQCGATSVIRDLATLAYARYRGVYFRRELIIALKIVDEGHISLAGMKGSWAGAMGQTQFMPSSFMRYAVDFQGNGRKDIWSDTPDALASTANFLARHGWVRGWTWGYEVLPPPQARLHSGETQNFSAWAAQGFRRADGIGMPREGRAALLMPAGANGPAFLTTKNFAVIRSYNNSVAYALGVALLSDRIAGEGPLKGTWPNQDIPTASLSR